MPNKTNTKTLIREMQENVAKYGRENTTTYLMVQAIAALQQQDRELEAVGAGGVQALSAAPAVPGPQEATFFEPIQAAADAASVGHLSRLLDHQSALLAGAMQSMRAIELAASPINESQGDFDARIPYNEWVSFVESRAALLHDFAQSPVASPTPPAEQQAQPGAVHAELPDLIGTEINDACWAFVKAMPHDLPGPIWINADDVQRLVRQLDVALNGENGAALQASLCDIVGQVVQAAKVLGHPVIDAAKAAPGEPSDASDILAKVCDLFQIGKLARTESTILINVENTIRFSSMLNAVERDLFPQPDLPEDDDPYAEMDENPPTPNKWGAKDEADYVAQFRAALLARGLAAPQQEAQEPARLSDEQIKAHGDKAAGMMARDQTRFDAACEVMNYLKALGAPGYYTHRMSIVLHGNTEGTEAARAPDTAPQPAPAPAPLSDDVLCCLQAAADALGWIANRQRVVGDVIEPVGDIRHASRLASEGHRRMGIAMTAIDAALAAQGGK